ncbi:SAM-dependent methyltransferase [Demetria terragena]|uniref:SAM-dependent methyltransferase n=1 Tax=Demetria terragena TaxID=63959 RepID=UPI00037675D2|nr:cyclopropane-fatty-acyl-phospholipid synthase family protein [Demetria terragena]
MTTLSAGPPRIIVDPERWPDVARVPLSIKARTAAWATWGIFRKTVGELAVRVVLPDGSVMGGARDEVGAPTMHLHRPEAFMRRVGSAGLIGFGESYLAGEWDSEDLAGLIAAFATGIDALVPAPLKRMRSFYLATQPRADRPTPENSRSNVARHYDLSNEMFALFLDSTMTYSSALFDNPSDDLVTAQHKKIDRMLDEAKVGPGSAVLEIGTGWGELALRAAARGAKVHSVTLSEEQQSLARNKIADAGYADNVDIELADYRTLTGTYDAVVSVEMIEAVGLDFLDEYFSIINNVLAPGGVAVIQGITMPHHRALETKDGYTWIHKYVFPGGALPSSEMLAASATQAGLTPINNLSMGLSYAETLSRWADQFSCVPNELEALGFDEVFRRMWSFYLRYSEGGFRAGYLDVQQLTYRKGA